MNLKTEEILDYIDVLYKDTNSAFFIFNMDNNNLEVVKGAVEKLTGKSLQEIKDNIDSVLHLIHNEDQKYVLEALSDKKDKKMKSLEFRAIVNGSERWLHLTLVFNKEISGYCAIGNLKDITASKTHTFLLDKFNAKKDATLNIISHDLASPLNTIQQLTDLIKKRAQKYEDAELEKLLNYIKETSKKGTDLIEDFVSHEFLETSKDTIIKKRTNLVQKIKSIEEDYKRSQEIIRKTFHFHYSAPEIMVNIDDLKFMQVLNNIYSNAIKFTHDNAIINTRIEAKEHTVLISIQDNGVGIPQQMQPLIFEKFTKARRPGLKGEKTVGLGMSIAKMIMEWHNGRIWFSSEENKGTTFFVEIPKE